jgi:hypothetical protein
MDWLEHHPVVTSISIVLIGYVVQALYTRWKVNALTEWQAGVNIKLQSIDNEINQIKISDAKEGVRMENVTTELARQTNDLVHMRAKLDDVHNMMIITLSGGKIGEVVKQVIKGDT